MKKFFRQEHLELDRVNGLTKEDSNLNHLEFMAKQEKLMADMESRLKLNLVDAITTFAETCDEEPTKSDDATAEMTSALSTITGNSNQKMDQMMKMFQGLCKKVDDLAAAQQGPATKLNNKENVNPRTGRAWRCYCWTHGCCDHWSNKCPQRKPGHKLNATFKNRMGGSIEGVIGA